MICFENLLCIGRTKKLPSAKLPLIFRQSGLLVISMDSKASA